MSKQEPEVIPISLGPVNAFLIKGERSILVDTGNPGDKQKILDALSSNGVTPKNISLIIITHCHSDHFGNIAALKEQTGAEVAIHKSEADALTKGVNAEICPVGIKGHIFKFLISFRKAKITGVKPDILIDRELALETFGVQGKVISTPGHTQGSISVVLASGDVIISDLLMAFTGRAPNYPIFAQDMSQVKKSLQLIMEYKPKKIYASHGGLFDPNAILSRFANDLKF
jgi:glyoxylase-like metal-dependent hydrolase (beta-lactamase superfamily II)